MKKIKKYISYILILIALVGVFSPIVSVNAQYDDSPDSTGDSWTPGADDETTNTNACASLDGIGAIICKIHQILNTIVPVLVALGVVWFVWGVVTYMIGGDEESKKKGKSRIVYGIIGLAVIVGLWGLVNIVVETFDLSGGYKSTSVLVSQPKESTKVFICELGDDGVKIQHVLLYGVCIINSAVVPLIFALAVAMFIWGVVQYVINSDQEAKKDKGRQFMIWGIIALAVMISVWGLVRILGNSFGIDYAVPQV